MSETQEQPAAPAAASKGGKLPIILGIVNFVAVLGLGGYFFYTQQHAAAQSQAKKAEGKAEKGEHGKAEEAEEGHEAPEGEHGEAKEEHEPQAGGHGEGGKEHEEEAASEHGDEHSGKGPLMPLEPMVTNLAEPDTDRYLKLTMQLRITSEAARAEVEASLVPVRNQILLYLSSLTLADTSGADNKREIQKRVKRIANEAMPSSRITQVYFTEFVIQ